MIKFLQNRIGVNVATENVAAVEMMRGAFVKVDEAKKELALAASDAQVYGVAVRELKVTDDVAMGVPVSDWDAEQDTILKGELAGVRVLLAGERYATDQYVKGLSDENAAAGKYLTVSEGKLQTSSSAAKFVSLGWVNVAGHKMLGFRLA